MKLSISVMAHPSRERFFDYIKSKVGDVPFSIDTKSQGVWENCKSAWKLHNPQAEYHLVIQDDAIICDNFRERAEKYLNKKIAYSFYYGQRKNLMSEAEKGIKNGYIIKHKIHWGVAICLPTKYILEMIAFCDKINIRQDDTRISKFLQKNKIRVCYPLPSLIDHRDEESLVGDHRGRQAFNFIDYENTKDNTPGLDRTAPGA